MSTAENTAGEMWGKGGRYYDEISFAISDALAHAAQRLDAQEGEKVLDVATGTGWSARNIARRGAEVTGIDIAADLLAAARLLSAHVVPKIFFEEANAEALPFRNASFDAVISTFGVMFAPDQAKAASEIARVCRPGGRVVLATWTPDGAVARFFAMIGQHSDAPPPAVSPLLWGDPKHVEKLLGGAFDLSFETGVSDGYHAGVGEMWDWFVRGFGPLRQLSERLPLDKLAALKRDFDAYHAHYAVPAGLHVKREYLITMGTRN